MNLDGKTILITGAAGRIGSAVAKQALKSNATVILADIDNEKLELLYQELEEFNCKKIFTIKSDVTNRKGIDYLIKESIIKAGRIDGAVHSVYSTSRGWGDSFEDLKSENLYQDLSIQLGGAIIFSQRILDYFCIEGGGDLIHISSILGVQSPKFQHYEGTEMTSPIEYTAIKSGIISITKWLAKYHKGKEIRVNCVSPGGILDSQPKVFLEKYKKDCTNVGMLSGSQVASTIVFLLSPAAIAINGQNIIVDDGWTL
tara:strand:+ start:1706 stop:2476 length:771 start_codon:yes stop_codon:yes gene_type:complete